MKRVYNKTVVAGNVLELTSFEKGVSINEPTELIDEEVEQVVVDENNKTDGVGGERDITVSSVMDEEVDSRLVRMIRDLENSERSLRRTKQNLTRSINANFGQWSANKKDNKFMTLTFRGEVIEYDFANAEFMKFIKRLNYVAFGEKKAKLKYTAVIEHHHASEENNGIHYHVLFYNLPYIEHSQLLKCWRGSRGSGGVNIKVIDSVDNVGAYVTKYIEKELQEKRKYAQSLKDEMVMVGSFTGCQKTDAMSGLERQFYKFLGNKDKKMYQQSQKLLKPDISYLDDEELEALVYEMKKRDDVIEVCDVGFEGNEFTGDIVYRQYKLKVTSDKSLMDLIAEIKANIIHDDIELDRME